MTNGIDQLQPGHVAAGLGGANREFLSVCLGVFDDARVLQRLENLFRMAFNKWTPIRDLVSARESVESSAMKWELDDKLTDERLRAILWIRLQRVNSTTGLSRCKEPARTPGCARVGIRSGLAFRDVDTKTVTVRRRARRKWPGWGDAAFQAKLAKVIAHLRNGRIRCTGSRPTAKQTSEVSLQDSGNSGSVGRRLKAKSEYTVG